MAASNPATHGTYSIRKNIVSLELFFTYLYIVIGVFAWKQVA